MADTIIVRENLGEQAVIYEGLIVLAMLTQAEVQAAIQAATNIDGLENLLSAINAGQITQAQIQQAIQAATNLDQIESLLTTLNGLVDGLEGVNYAQETTLQAVRDRQRVSAFSAGSTQTNATGTNWTALAAGACTQIVLRNRTGTSIDFRIAGDAATVFTLASGEDIPLPCLANSDEWEIRRTDTSNTQVIVRFLRFTR